MYFCNKTNQMHNISNLFYFGTTLYMFRTVFPSIIRVLRLYIQDQVYVIQFLWLLKQPRTKMHFYSKTNQIHKTSNLFYFGTTLHMFRTVFPSIIRSLRLYIQHQLYQTDSADCLLAGTRQNQFHLVPAVSKIWLIYS